MAKSVCIIPMTNSANTEKLGSYWSSSNISYKLINNIVWLQTNTADLGPVTGPVVLQNFLINNIIIYTVLEILIEFTCLYSLPPL